MALYFSYFPLIYNMLHYCYIDEYIKDMFLMYRVAKIELSINWLVKALYKSYHNTLNPLQLRDFFSGKGVELGVAPKLIRVPVAADYEQLDGQGHPVITAYHCEVARPFTLSVQDWLTEEELRVFASPTTETV